MVRDRDIDAYLSMASATSDTASGLVEAANRHGGADNITVMLCDVVGLPANPRTVVLSDPYLLMAGAVAQPLAAGRSGVEKKGSTLGKILIGIAALAALITAVILFWPPISRETADATFPPAPVDTTATGPARKPPIPVDRQKQSPVKPEKENVSGADKPQSSETAASPRVKPPEASPQSVDAQKAGTSPGGSLEGTPIPSPSSIEVLPVSPGGFYLVHRNFAGNKDAATAALMALREKHPGTNFYLGRCQNNYFILLNKFPFKTAKDAEDRTATWPNKDLFTIEQPCP